jgi:hypothetical protein
MVDRAVEFVDQLTGEPKLKLIETLREVTEGKVKLFAQYFFCSSIYDIWYRYILKCLGLASPVLSRG